MGRVIFVAGLPGSGKTEYIKRLAREINAESFDDFKNQAIGDNPNFNFSRHFQDLIRGLNAGRTFIVSDIDFCLTESRSQAEQFVHACAPTAQIEWHCFENDPDQCQENVTRRARETPRDLPRELERIVFYAARYEPPCGALVLPVWRPNT